MEGVRVIELTRGQFTIVDEADYEALSKFNWQCAGRRNYAKRTDYSEPKRRNVWMHRVILGVADNFEVDHINGNGLDNRRCNLRPATKQQNQWNAPKRRKASSTSIYKGVAFNKVTGKWIAAIKDPRAKIAYHLGTFADEADAGRAYDAAAHYFFQEFALYNFPDETPAPFTPKPPRVPSSDYPGVYYSGKKWHAGICVGRKRVHLGRYDLEADAIAARQAAEREYGRA